MSRSSRNRRPEREINPVALNRALKDLQKRIRSLEEFRVKAIQYLEDQQKREQVAHDRLDGHDVYLDLLNGRCGELEKCDLYPIVGVAPAPEFHIDPTELVT